MANYDTAQAVPTSRQGGKQRKAMHSIICAMAILAALIGNSCRNRQRLPRSFEVVCVRCKSPGDCEESQHIVCQHEGRDERVGDERVRGCIVISLYSDTCHILYGNNTINESLLFAQCLFLYMPRPHFIRLCYARHTT